MVNTVLLIVLIGLIVYGVARNPSFFSRLYRRALWSEKAKDHKADEMVIAIHDDELQAVAEFLELGTSPNISCDDGNRPLHLAARGGKIEIAQRRGRRPDSSAKFGSAPFSSRS